MSDSVAGNEVVRRPIWQEVAESNRVLRYMRFVGTTFRHGLLSLLRRRGVLLAAVLSLTPVIIPLALAFFSSTPFSEDGNRIFVRLVETVYLMTLAPLLALFFGCMLIGEDVESQTIPFLLTRPLPRSALVLGRYAAYLMISSCIMMVSVTMTFAACSTLSNLPLSAETLRLLAHYDGIAFMALASYGALALFLGSLMKHPVIFGVILIFGWQRLAMYVPGLVDFVTIQKYLDALLPALATQRQNPVVKTALFEFEKQQLLIGAPKALVALMIVCGLLLLLTSLVCRWREYSTARAVGG